jgi:hypothetical protein
VTFSRKQVIIWNYFVVFIALSLVSGFELVERVECAFVPCSLEEDLGRY